MKRRLPYNLNDKKISYDFFSVSRESTSHAVITFTADPGDENRSQLVVPNDAFNWSEFQFTVIWTSSVNVAP